MGGDVTLVPLTADHAVELAPLLDDTCLHRYIGGQPLSLLALTERYRKLEAGAPPDSEERWMNWVIRRSADEKAVGTAQATLRGDTAHVAWVVARRWQGLGYAREAARAVVAWLKTRHGLTVVANIHPEHVASERVARSAGLTPTDEWVEGERVWRTEGLPGA